MTGPLGLLVAAVLCCGGYRADAAIATITETASLSPEADEFSHVPVSFEKFDPSLGKLASVEIILQGTGQIMQRYENTANRRGAARLRENLDLFLTLPNVKRPVLKAHQSVNHKYAVGAFDGVVDFEGTSGDTGIYDVTASKKKLLSNQRDLAMFTGSGLADVLLSARGPSHHSPFRESSVEDKEMLAGADIKIIYSYVPAVLPVPAPEPASCGLLAGATALAVVGGAAVRRGGRFSRGL